MIWAASYCLLLWAAPAIPSETAQFSTLSILTPCPWCSKTMDAASLALDTELDVWLFPMLHFEFQLLQFKVKPDKPLKNQTLKSRYLSVFSTFISGLQELLFVHLLSDSSNVPSQLGGQSQRPEEWKMILLEPWCYPRGFGIPLREGDLSQFIQLEEDWKSPWMIALIISIFYHLQHKNKEWGSVVYPEKGNSLGAEVCFRRCISGSLRENGWKAINLNLSQTRPLHLNLRRLVQVWNP